MLRRVVGDPGAGQPAAIAANQIGPHTTLIEKHGRRAGSTITSAPWRARAVAGEGGQSARSSVPTRVPFFFLGSCLAEDREMIHKARHDNEKPRMRNVQGFPPRKAIREVVHYFAIDLSSAPGGSTERNTVTGARERMLSEASPLFSC